MTDDQDDLENLNFDERPTTPAPVRSPRRKLATDTLATLVLEEAIVPERRRSLKRSRSFALVVEAPSSDWVGPMRVACEAMVGWTTVFAHNGSLKSEHKTDKGNAKVASTLAEGGRVLGVSQTPDRLLPATLLTAADLRVKIEAPSNEVIAKAIRMATGQTPEDLPPLVAAGLDYFEICGAIRVRTTARSCVERLVAAVRAKSTVDAGVADAPPFSTLMGYSEAHVWGSRLIADLDEWRHGRLPFEQISRHGVLASDPGLGKTLFVRSLARAARVPLLVCSVSNWFSNSNGYLDGVVKAIDGDFAAARARAPSILFLDELDAVPNRATMSDRAREWWTPVVTNLLLQIDSATSGGSARVCVIGATNHAQHLDPALIRPGRLGRVFTIPPLDASAVAGIMRQRLGDELPDADLEAVAELGVGSTGAIVVSWIDGARSAARVRGSAMRIEDVVAQIAPPDARSPQEMRRSSVHEAGHAVVCQLLGVGRIKSVDVIAREGAGGRTLIDRSAVGGLYGVDLLEANATVSLAGRGAEIELLGSATTGAGGGKGSDLAEATRLVAGLHGSYGLGKTLTHRGDPQEACDGLQYDRDLREIVEADLRRLFDRALCIVGKHRHAIEAVAARLLERRHLTGPQFLAVLDAAGNKRRVSRGRSGASHGR